MSEEKIIIYRVAVSLTKGGFKESVIKCEGHETDLLFIVYEIDHASINNRRHFVKKSKLMRPDTGVFLINHQSVHYLTWCFPDQIDDAKAMCKEWVIEHAKRIREEASALFEHLEK